MVVRNLPTPPSPLHNSYGDIRQANMKYVPNTRFGSCCPANGDNVLFHLLSVRKRNLNIFYKIPSIYTWFSVIFSFEKKWLPRRLRFSTMSWTGQIAFTSSILKKTSTQRVIFHIAILQIRESRPDNRDPFGARKTWLNGRPPVGLRLPRYLTSCDILELVGCYLATFHKRRESSG